MTDAYAYFDKYDEDDFKIKKNNRRRKIDKRAQANEDFMKVNGQGIKSVILPLIAKKGRQARNNGRDV